MKYLRGQWPALLMVALLVVFRWVGMKLDWANVQPLAAVTFCAMAFVGWRAMWVPFLAWSLSYVVMTFSGSFTMGWDILASFLGFLAVAGVAYFFQKREKVSAKLGGVILGSVLFYLISNTVSWLTLPDYALTGAGFLQAQWFGPPHLGPTWVFLRSALVADVAFTGLLILAMQPVGRLVSSREPSVV